ncbi:hypothetical protein FGB62_69g05 [Gracilaria domingensis]|nr:hypothetical protein FGB62_69g05 [Gracilaria domingensis]
MVVTLFTFGIVAGSLRDKDVHDVNSCRKGGLGAAQITQRGYSKLQRDGGEHGQGRRAGHCSNMAVRRDTLAASGADGGGGCARGRLEGEDDTDDSGRADSAGSTDTGEELTSCGCTRFAACFRRASAPAATAVGNENLATGVSSGATRGKGCCCCCGCCWVCCERTRAEVAALLSETLRGRVERSDDSGLQAEKEESTADAGW